MTDQERYTLEEAHIKFAKSANGQVWELLENKGRSNLENEELLIAAYSSLYHWRQVGNPVNTQRGYWLLSHVFVELERSDEALEYALRCKQLTERDKDSMEDFDIAYAQEALARAYAFQGQSEIARGHFERARELGELIADAEDKKIFTDDLMGGDWTGVI